MRLLAFDTATEACSVALLSGDTLRGECLELGRGHSERLLPMIDALLADAGLSLGELDALAFGRGPGAFTGVRLAASVAQGLAFAARLPVVPVSDLAAVALRVLRGESAAPGVLVCNDARMGQVYAGAFRRDGAGLPEAVAAEAVLGPDEVPGTFAAVLAKGWHGAGHGFRAYPGLASALQPLLAGVRAECLPRAEEIALLAAGAFARGETVGAGEALPVYLRDNVARPQL